MKKYFPIFYYYKKIIYFDNSSTNQKPKIYFKSILNCIKKKNFNINRGDNFFIKKVNLSINKFKLLIKKLILNNYLEEIVILFNSTYSINFILKSLINLIIKNKYILISNMEHNSIILPFLKIIKLKNCKLIVFPTINNNLCKNLICNYFKKNIIFFVVNQISNLGLLNNIKKISIISHYNNCIIIVDATQSISFININIKCIKADFFFFSLHKIFSSTGVSILYYNLFYLNKLIIINYGSGITNIISYKKIKFKNFYEKFEIGTQNLLSIFSSYYSIKWFIKNKKYFFYINNYLKHIFQIIFKKKKKNLINNYLIKINKNIFFINFIELNKIICRCDLLCNFSKQLFLSKNKNCRISINFYNNIKEIIKLKFLIFFFNYNIINY
ncbi:aminotransferase class V-fold PLP-dependent enzyme [Candidatus Carsonella ruddii]|uniref:Putative selenocysteine lyase n=1 Tax=Candidatus Carsonella ruddii PC isolate NHV TaxID=1202540 RepID=J3TEN2_CARRU|nr:aminotransferase class V-fold PLP-dependent enzyme [Candidatus Carsonella ruddii]AFP84262.1 putative selenocysteine lyase [Candidatus Carsonella ruddii PC isolate NHV]